ncbi:hypothetical protein [Dokdonia sp.]|uniref:hypothetical protein n=1 Tax=Dokdonia sp. TaxID=2024995 RepID=UPI00326516F6
MKSTEKLLILFLSLLILISCKTSNLLRKPKTTYSSAEILKMAEWRFDYDLENVKLCDLYILDGVPYEKKAIDSILAKYDKRDIRMISFLEKPEENTWLNKNCDLIPQIQTRLIEQTREYKTEILNRIIKIYSKYDKEIKIAGTSCDYCPLIILNNKPFFASQSQVLSKIRELKINEIDYIADYKKSHNIEYFGSLSKNGVVEIFTK